MNGVRLDLRLVLHQSINDIDSFPDPTGDEVREEQDIQVAHMVVGDASKPTITDMLLCQQVLFCQIVLRPISSSSLARSPTQRKRTPMEAVDDITKRSLQLFCCHMTTIEPGQRLTVDLSSQVAGQLVGSQITVMWNIPDRCIEVRGIYT